jgi:hypothetical protein
MIAELIAKVLPFALPLSFFLSLHAKLCAVIELEINLIHELPN